MVSVFSETEVHLCEAQTKKMLPEAEVRMLQDRSAAFARVLMLTRPDARRIKPRPSPAWSRSAAASELCLAWL